MEFDESYSPLKDKGGFLNKLGNKGLIKGLTWKYRYFLFKPVLGELFYYPSANDTTPLGVIDLKTVESVQVTPLKELTSSTNLGKEFNILCPRRKYVLVADSPEEMNSWVNCLQVSLVAIKSGRTWERRVSAQQNKELSQRHKRVSVQQIKELHQRRKASTDLVTITEYIKEELDLVTKTEENQSQIVQKNLDLPPFQNNKNINEISNPLVGQALNLRCCFDNVDSNARVPLAPYILLDTSESPVPFEDAILCAYEGASISSHLDSYMAHGEGEIFECLVKKGTTVTLPECLAVYFYTLEWPQKDLNTYSRLNKCLVSENREGARPWRFFLHYLFGALRKIPKWNVQQDLYRGVACNLVLDYPDKYILGSKITWYSLTSTSTNLSRIMNFLPPNKPRTIFTINGVFSGRPIQNFSAMPAEAEILIPPGSRFEIVGVAHLDPNTTMIQIKQVPSLEKQLNLE